MPEFQGQWCLSKQWKNGLNDMSMLVLCFTMLLVSMQARRVIGYAMLVLVIGEWPIFIIPICLDSFDLLIQMQLNIDFEQNKNLTITRKNKCFLQKNCC